MGNINDEDFKVIKDILKIRNEQQNNSQTEINSNSKKEVSIKKMQTRVPSKKNLEIAKSARKNSVKKSEIDYKPTTKELGIRFTAAAMGVILSVISTLTIAGILKIKNNIDDKIQEEKIDSAIVQMIAPEENSIDTISYSTYRIDNDTFAYNTALLAREFIQCEPEYFDLLIYNAYDNMQYNRKKNMNDLFHALYCYTYNLEETNPELYYKLKGIQSFDDYLEKIKCVDENGEPSLEKFVQYGKSLYDLHVDHLENEYGRKNK